MQANLAVLPREHAYDFLLFCQRNPRPCPLIEVTDPGNPEPVGAAPGADLRTDIGKYRIYAHGELAAEVDDIEAYWRNDLVAFLLGCSFTFEWALIDAGVRLWHIEHGKGVAMWRTSIACRPAGGLRGPMVVSMRPIRSADLAKAVTTSARYPGAHGERDLCRRPDGEHAGRGVHEGHHAPRLDGHPRHARIREAPFQDDVRLVETGDALARLAGAHGEEIVRPLLVHTHRR